MYGFGIRIILELKGRNFKGKIRLQKNKFYTAGGTIDKVYFDQKSTYQVGEPTIGEILEQANVGFEYDCESLLNKDSLDMTDADREMIFAKIKNDPAEYIVITHGTDTMIETAKMLGAIGGKVIVLTGSMQPARFRTTDAMFNLGCAIAAVQSKPQGVYIAMNGRILDPGKIRKNRKISQFIDLND
ncbi:MAG: asparaginase [Planctomycetes bacterium]|nr:asparaginase [Planctomycetota bacterium]